MPPILTPNGDIYGGLDPSIWINWPGGNWVFARIRGQGLSIWNGSISAIGISAWQGMGFDCCPGQADLVAASHKCYCNSPCPGAPGGPFPGLPVPFTGCCDGTSEGGGNVQSFPLSGAISYDLEALGFTVTPDNLSSSAAAVFSTTPGIGPLTIDAVTFPGPGTLGADYTDGHNLNERRRPAV